MNLKKITIVILVLLISTISYASEIKGSAVLKKLSGMTLKNYPINTIKGYVSENGALTIKVKKNGSTKKFKGKVIATDSDNINWTKGKEGASTLTLVGAFSSDDNYHDYWKLKDNNGWETPAFYMKKGNYYKY